ncbi:MAG: arylesterase [Roseicyclus sp.]|nr:arylesterase [Roseicyclus sp.]
MIKHFRSRLPHAYGALGAWGKAVMFSLVTLPVAADEITIAALGDSLTAGYGLVSDEGFVPQLQAWLDARDHDVRVINAGVSGDTTAGGLARATWTLTPEVDAMILALGGNDFLRGIDPAVSRANLAGILEEAAAAEVAVLLVGIVSSGNYGPEYRDAFNAMYPDLANEYGTLLDPDFFNGFREVVAEGALLSDFMLRDGIHPNAAGVALIVETLGPQVEALLERVAE